MTADQLSTTAYLISLFGVWEGDVQVYRTDEGSVFCHEPSGLIGIVVAPGVDQDEWLLRELRRLT